MTPLQGTLVATRRLWAGTACALGAGLLWGLVFVAPVILPDYPPWILSVGRYLAFGLIALPLAFADRRALMRLGRTDWRRALELSLVGNLLYYGCLAAAIQFAGAPLPTMLIGTLPVVIAVCSNLTDPALAWRKLLPPLAVIAAGILLVNHAELERADEDPARSAERYLLGALLAIGAVACWTWYPIRNARWLREHPQFSPGTWATAQGLMTLPLAAAGWLLAAVWYGVAAPAPMGDAAVASPAPFAFPLGPRPGLFIGLMLLIGLTASWLGTLLWNRASQLLPTSLAGQLIVFETLSALAYAYAWRGAPPKPAAAAGIAVLIAGVVLGVRTFQQRAPAKDEATR